MEKEETYNDVVCFECDNTQCVNTEKGRLVIWGQHEDYREVGQSIQECVVRDLYRILNGKEPIGDNPFNETEDE